MTNQVTATEQQFANGFRLLTWKDARDGPARRVRAVVHALEHDLGDDLPVAQRMLVHRCAVLASLCTHSEAVLLNGGAINISDYLGMTTTLSRLLKLLGIRRVAREVTTLSDLLHEDQHHLEQQREAEQEASCD